MSWEATAWAAKQRTGSPSNKLMLFALANYADPEGVCWPAQDTLASDTEQSVDTVQRRIKVLARLGFVTIQTRPGKRGQWAGRIYRLAVPVAKQPEQRSSATPPSSSNGVSHIADHAAPCPKTMPQQARSPSRKALRHKPLLERSIEPSRASARRSANERLLAFQSKQEGSEVVQNRIAQRIGPQGWLILGEMTAATRARLTTLERRGALDDATLITAVQMAQAPRESP